MAAASQQSDSKGFVEESSLILLNKNFYFNRDFKNNPGGQSHREEWAHGISTMFESGFTQGTVGFGVDAHAMLGLKLDSGGGTRGTGLLPIGDDGKAQDDYSYAGGAVKARVSNTVLKYGDLFPANPVFATGTARLFPSSATGFMLTSGEIENLTLDAGHFTATRDGSRSTNRDGALNALYAGVEARSADYFGGTYGIGDNLSLTLYGSEFEDIWRQYYGNANYNIPFNDSQALNFDFNIYRTNDEGSAKAGEIGNTLWSLAAAYSMGAHKFTLAHQRARGDEPMDYLGHDFNAGDSIFVANSVQISDFNGPEEKSWQARYDLNMAEYGVPGLSFMARYVKGYDVDGTKADPDGAYANLYLGESDGDEHETNVEAKYVLQNGPAKDLSFRLRTAFYRADSGINNAQAADNNDTRLIIEYPLEIL